MLPCPECPLPPLDCETTWVREEGCNGRLYQEISITFRVPDGYESGANPVSVAVTLTDNPAVPTVETPVAVGVSDEDAKLIPGKEYTYTTTYVDREGTIRFLFCGEFFYVAIGIYTHGPVPCLHYGTSPVSPDWVYISDMQYQVGVDEEIVIEDVELVPNL